MGNYTSPLNAVGPWARFSPTSPGSCLDEGQVPANRRKRGQRLGEGPMTWEVGGGGWHRYPSSPPGPRRSTCRGGGPPRRRPPRGPRTPPVEAPAPAPGWRRAAGEGPPGRGGLKVCRKQRHSSTGTNSVRIPIADFEPNQTPVSTSGPRGLMVGCRFPPLPVPSTSLSDIPHRILFYIFPSISRWHHCDCSIDIAFGWQTEH